MGRLYFLGLLGIMAVSLWGCSNLAKRYPADVGVVGPSGDMILLYKERGEIVIKECQDHAVPRPGGDCALKRGREERRIAVEEFRILLKIALRLPNEHDPQNEYNPQSKYDPQMKRKINIYNQGKSMNIQDKLQRRKQYVEKIANIENFIAEFGKENADTYYLSILRMNLESLEDSLDNDAKFEQITSEINQKIDDLIGKIIDNSEIKFYVYSTQKTHFVYNILRAILKLTAISFEFQTIEGGSFTMGSPKDEAKRDKDEKQKLVIISKTFQITKTEVTQRQWLDVMLRNPSRFKKPKHCSNHESIRGQDLCPTHPVENVSWEEVQTFIKRLNEFLGLYHCYERWDAKGCYRLPTEAEWEFAARGGTKTAYFFGDDPSLLDDYAWYRENSNRQTHPVGLKRKNPYGLFDMHGNVWEWVQDRYIKNFPENIDPLQSNPGSGRIVRGGSWKQDAQYLRSANRRKDRLDNKNEAVGFRLVRTL